MSVPLTDALTIAPLPAAAVSAWALETDVIVVGFGAAGTCAAIEARQAGAEVMVFDVAASAGGSAALAGGEVYVGGSGGTSVQRANGFTDTTDDFEKYLMMAGGPDADAEKVHLYATQAVAHFEWLQAQGVPYKGTYLPGKWLEPLTDDTLVWSGSEAAWPFVQQARPAPRGHTAQLTGWGAGKILMETLSARAEGLGAQIHYSSRALRLIQDVTGRVVGLVVRIDGREVPVRARRGVVLSAGGFITNPAMLAHFAPGALVCNNPVSAGNDDGSGIRMGMGAGGDAIHMDEFFATMPFFPPESLVKGIFVNEQGRRFINEDAYHGRITHYILRQKKAWLLVDNAIFDRPLLHPDVVVAAVGETWDALEAELGLTMGALEQTVIAFNHHAALGRDPAFHKQADWLRPLTEAPFAALSFNLGDFPVNMFTLGGLRTRPTGEVLRADGTAVSGLYAAGRCACGLPRWGEGYSSGMSIGDATFFGRQAGRQAALS